MPPRKSEPGIRESPRAADRSAFAVCRAALSARRQVCDEIVLAWSPGAHATLELAGATHELSAATFVLFWGGFPHRFLLPPGEPAPVTVRMPFGWFAGLPVSTALVDALLGGRLASDWAPDPGDARLVERWLALEARAERRLLTAARFELTARLIRLEHALPVAFLAPTPELRGELRELAAKEATLEHATDRASRLLAFLQANYARPIDVAECARAAELSPRHASELFKRAYGRPLKTHLNGLRLKHAQRLLATTHEKVQGIANACGFASASRFYDAFVREVGLTPQAFRERSPRPALPERHDAPAPGLPPMLAWVDESPANNYEERRFLHGLGLLCDSYTRNGDVIAALASGRYSLVISDCGRGPDADDGWALLREVRSRGWRIPFLFYTGSASEERIARASREGAQGVFDRSRPLVDRVLELLGR